MSVRTETFDPPVVRARVDRISFPKTCPVCGEDATVFTKMKYSKREYNGLNPHWAPRASMSGIRQSEDIKTNTLYIPTCENHHYTDEGEMKYKMLCTLIDGVLFSILLVSSLAVGGDLWLGRAVPSYLFGLLLVFGMSMGLTILAFRPPAVLQAVRFVGFDADFKYIWLDLENEAYRNAFLEKNSMNAELVRWVKRA